VDELDDGYRTEKWEILTPLMDTFPTVEILETNIKWQRNAYAQLRKF
jgi:hypothetical protein